MMNVKAFGLTHVGRQRQHNEDSFLVENEAHLFLVADGMGGHAAGERMANARVLEAMRKDARLRGMGTTVVACIADDNNTVSVAHVGDSRAYLIRDNQLSRITNDHSWVFEQVQAGMLTEAAAEI